MTLNCVQLRPLFGFAWDASINLEQEAKKGQVYSWDLVLNPSYLDPNLDFSNGSGFRFP
jgi:hypothetical protein